MEIQSLNLESRSKWIEYSEAKDAMFAHTDTVKSPWLVVNGDNKKRARLNSFQYDQIRYKTNYILTDVTHLKVRG